MSRILAYIRFLLKSTNQHGVHSPFIYKLITECFYDTSKHTSYTALKQYKSLLLANKTVISVTDLGAKSQVMPTNKRRVSHIAKNAGTTYKRVKLLYRLTHYFQFNTVLEIGTSLGIATQALSLGNSKSKIITIEGCPNTSKIASKQLSKFGVNNVELVTGNFNAELKSLQHNTYDFIFFDGNHQKEATLTYFNTLLKTAHNDSVFIFDDIYWSKGMTQAWEIIKQHPKVTVTINTFFWGIVFFRKEQKKEHFTIRL